MSCAAAGTGLSLPSHEPSVEDLERGELMGIVPRRHEEAASNYRRVLESFVERKASGLDALQLRNLKKDVESAFRPVRVLRDELSVECQLIFTRACRPDFPFILGGENLRSSTKHSTEIMCNFGILAGASHQAPRAVVLANPDINLQNGGVLCDGSWSVFKNDFAMAGVIASGRSCFISQPKDADLEEDLWSSASPPRPKVLGREIAMLIRAGYVQVASEEQIEKCGYVFVPKDRAKLASISVKDLVIAAEKVRDVAKLLEFLIPDDSEDRASPETVSIASARSSPMSVETERRSPLSVLSPRSSNPSPSPFFSTGFQASGGGSEKE